MYSHEDAAVARLLFHELQSPAADLLYVLQQGAVATHDELGQKRVALETVNSSSRLGRKRGGRYEVEVRRIIHVVAAR
jgi:hypothetical protein